MVKDYTTHVVAPRLLSVCMRERNVNIKAILTSQTSLECAMNVREERKARAQNILYISVT